MKLDITSCLVLGSCGGTDFFCGAEDAYTSRSLLIVVISDGWICSDISVLMGVGNVDPLRMERAGPIWGFSAIAGSGYRTAGLTPNIIKTSRSILLVLSSHWKLLSSRGYCIIHFQKSSKALREKGGKLSPLPTPRTPGATAHDLRQNSFYLIFGSDS